MFMSPVVRSRRNLFSEFNRMQNDLEQLFSAVSVDKYDSNLGLDVWNSGDELIVTAEIPGLKASDISTTVEANQLIIDAEFKDDLAEKGEGKYLRKERKRGRYSRMLRLPYDVEVKDISATYNNGVLTVNLPKAEACKARKIEVKTAG